MENGWKSGVSGDLSEMKRMHLFQSENTLFLLVTLEIYDMKESSVMHLSYLDVSFCFLWTKSMLNTIRNSIY